MSKSERYFEALDYLAGMRRRYDSEAGMENIYYKYRTEVEEGIIPQSVAFQDYVLLQFFWLTRVESFYWSPELVSMLDTVSQSLPECTIREELFPVDMGFFYFGKKIHLGMSVTWRGTQVEQILRGFVWRVHSGGTLVSVTTILEDALGRPTPGHTWPWEMGHDYTTWAGTAAEGTATTNPSKYPLKPEERKSIELAKKDTGFLKCMKLVVSALLLVNQTILKTETKEVPRAARRRFLKGGKDTGLPTVRVVLLRRQVGPKSELPGEPVIWSCHWLVRGHWRQQACGEGRRDRKPVWILPYIKGDLDAPLKPPDERIFAVVR